jgi:transcription initiation factor TFIIIB Brf1 subunit/transcription initiation factor TFIIB
MSDIDHEYTDEIVCPYCGNVFGDSWECSPNDENGWTECDECGRVIEFTRNIIVSYSTTEPSSTRAEVFGIPKDYQCSICHMAGDVRFDCEYCGHLVCADCEEKKAECCSWYKEVKEQEGETDE